jgi:putative transposase
VRERDGCRVVHFTVQSNHLHVIAEARDAMALARGVQALSIRIARAVNRVLGRRGPVFADRS